MDPVLAAAEEATGDPDVARVLMDELEGAPAPSKPIEHRPTPDQVMDVVKRVRLQDPLYALMFSPAAGGAVKQHAFSIVKRLDDHFAVPIDTMRRLKYVLDHGSRNDLLLLVLCGIYAEQDSVGKYFFENSRFRDGFRAWVSASLEPLMFALTGVTPQGEIVRNAEGGRVAMRHALAAQVIQWRLLAPERDGVVESAGDEARKKRMRKGSLAELNAEMIEAVVSEIKLDYMTRVGPIRVENGVLDHAIARAVADLPPRDLPPELIAARAEEIRARLDP